MEKQCNCGGTGDCVSREDYKKALQATAYLAEKVKILEEKYKLALFSPEAENGSISESVNTSLQPPSPPEKTQDLQSLKTKGNGWGSNEWNQENQVKVTMANPLPPGLSSAKEIKLEDKDTVLDEECMSCSA
tara:strand:- start:942 stop:1337 length:396 start_codon:yes stop_codon:yes gene_type:complete